MLLDTVDIEYSESCLSIVGESRPISSASVGVIFICATGLSFGEVPGELDSDILVGGRLGIGGVFLSLLRRSLCGRAPRLLERGLNVGLPDAVSVVDCFSRSRMCVPLKIEMCVKDSKKYKPAILRSEFS